MSNNKQTMKLYTEEQVRKTWNDAFMEGMSIDSEIYEPVFFEDHLNKLTPIELPSDEEILHQSDEFELNSRESLGMHLSFEIGAKWMRDKIQGGNT